MASILVLVRHGKAESREEGVDDFTRRLTPHGRRALRAGLADELLPLASMPEFLKGETEIWSSPALRALDTAEEVARVLDISEVCEYDSLYEQDKESFMDEFFDSEADVVIAVGHDPFVGDLSELLCGQRLPFKTGAAAFFDLNGYTGEPSDTCLRAFSQGPRTARWKVLTEVESLVAVNAEQARANIAAFVQMPEDIEALHDFRVSVRSLRSQLAFLAPYLKKAQLRDLNARLKSLVGKTSHMRELDVFIDEFQASECANDEVLALLRARRAKECRRLLNSLVGKKNSKEMANLFGAIHALRWKNHIEGMGLSKQDLEARFELICMRFDAAYLEADYFDVEATHSLRKQAKGVRYAAREFSSLLGPDAESVPAEMREIQDELGALCDARVNCDIIDSLPRKKLSDQADMSLALFKQVQLDVMEEILAETMLGEEEVEEEVDDFAATVAEFDVPEALVDNGEAAPCVAGPAARARLRMAQHAMAPRWERMESLDFD